MSVFFVLLAIVFFANMIEDAEIETELFLQEFDAEYERINAKDKGIDGNQRRRTMA